MTITGEHISGNTTTEEDGARSSGDLVFPTAVCALPKRSFAFRRASWQASAGTSPVPLPTHPSIPSHASLVALQQLGALLEEHLQQTRSVCSWLDPLAVKVLIFKKNLLKSSLNHCLCLQGAEWVCSAFCCEEKSPRFSPSCIWGLFLMHYLETWPGEERVLGGLDKTGCSGEKKCKALGIGCCELTFQFCHSLAANPGGKNLSVCFSSQLQNEGEVNTHHIFCREQVLRTYEVSTTSLVSFALSLFFFIFFNYFFFNF